jgi:hypothetical protein
MIPAELRERPQWVVWRREIRQGKPTKVPYNPAESHALASVSDPSTWSSFEQATAVEGVDGIGFVFSEDDPFCGIDLDRCIDENGELHPAAAKIVHDYDSYTETSPSGTGLHIIIKAEHRHPRNKISNTPWGGHLEVYDRGRFFTVTGKGTRVLHVRVDEHDRMTTEVFPAETPTRTPVGAVGLDDHELLERARAAKNGATFDALYRGLHSYGSQSEADLALCNMLAFWTAGDPARMDRLFRSSGLMREKWDSRRGESSYGAQTIDRAIAGCAEFYEGNGTARATPTVSTTTAGTVATGTKAKAIKPRRIRWVWKGRLARGYMSLWTGESSLGKSTFFCRVASELTHGTLDGHTYGEPGTVLIVAAEDAREDVWVPRLMAAKADLDRVVFQNQNREWNLRDGMALTTAAIEEAKPQIVFVDSIIEHLPDPKSGQSINSAQYIRQSLGPFADLCKAHNVAGLISTHPPKAKGSTFADMVLASVAFIQMTRVGLLFAWHPDDLDLDDQERRRVLMRPPGGSNIGRDPGPVEFHVGVELIEIEGENEEVPYIADLQPSSVMFRDLTRTPRDEPIRPQIADAKLLIEQRLSDNRWHPSMVEELVGQGFKKSTAYNAADGVRKRKSPTGEWWWGSSEALEPDFVQLSQNAGSSRARARRDSWKLEHAPKPHDNPYRKGSSNIPADLDETSQVPSRGGQVPDLEVVRAREEGSLVDATLKRWDKS